MSQSVVDFLTLEDLVTVLVFVFFSLEYLCLYFLHSFSSYQDTLRLNWSYLHNIILMLFLLLIFFIFNINTFKY